jgi:hypothetical protein
LLYEILITHVANAVISTDLTFLLWTSTAPLPPASTPPLPLHRPHPPHLHEVAWRPATWRASLHPRRHRRRAPTRAAGLHDGAAGKRVDPLSRAGRPTAACRRARRGERRKARPAIPAPRPLAAPARRARSRRCSAQGRATQAGPARAGLGGGCAHALRAAQACSGAGPTRQGMAEPCALLLGWCALPPPQQQQP